VVWLSFSSLYLFCIKIYSFRLHLPSEIVPATHKKAIRPARSAAVRPGGGGGDGAYRAPRGGDRDGYRSKKDEGAPGEYRPQFAGVGRGAPRE
jgi:small subunit ribosomal protein S10e